MKLFTALGALTLGLASNALAQNVTYCPSTGVCLAVNVPASTASSGSGDLYFQITGPTTMSWIGIGQGSSMSGSNIFMMYANADGTNVTLSPRTGTGNQSPSTSSTADVTLLAGSGISNGVMIANVRCSNCNSWTGGTMDLTSTSSKWIWAYKSGSAISSDSLTVSLAQHNKYGSTTLNLQNAAGGSSTNPFATTVATTDSSSSSSSGSGSSSSSSSSSSGGGGGSIPDYYDKVVMTHAIVACVAWALFFPLGAIGIRLLSFKNLVWYHAGWMIFTYIIVLGSMGMGVWIAVVTGQLDTTHSIVGIFVVAALLLQPITGLTHHLLYKKVGRPNAATYPHVWWGRAIITLAIINGGLGLQLADNPSNGGTVAYGVAAGIVWAIWMGVIVIAFLRSRNKIEGETGESAFEKENSSRTNIRMNFYSEQNSPVQQSYSNSATDLPQNGRLPVYR